MRIVAQPMVYTIPQISNPSSSAERWASYVLGACKSEKDPRTLAIWAREVAVSYTSLCESCRLIGIQPRQARDFSRVLRLLIRRSLQPYELASLLDISDRRTLDSIFQNAGLPHKKFITGPVSMLAFLNNQRFIPHENIGLKIIRDILSRRDLANSA